MLHPSLWLFYHRTDVFATFVNRSLIVHYQFKRMVVETMKKEHLSIYAAMQEFGINDHKITERWERIYLEEGPEGLAIERRGRSSKGRPPKQLPKQVEEDLLAEVQRLRAEVEYLKNLQALVLEDERRQHKKRW